MYVFVHLQDYMHYNTSSNAHTMAVLEHSLHVPTLRHETGLVSLYIIIFTLSQQNKYIYAYCCEVLVDSFNYIMTVMTKYQSCSLRHTVEHGIDVE